MMEPEPPEVPDGWHEVRFELNESTPDMQTIDARWQTDEETVGIILESIVEENRPQVAYSILVEQRVEDDEYATTIQSHSRVEESLDRALDAVVTFMEEVNAGEHRLRVLGTDKWREYVQFYCLSDSELDGGLTADVIIDAVDNEEFDHDIEDMPDEPEQYAEDMLTVDVYPRHESDVEVIEE